MSACRDDDVIYAPDHLPFAPLGEHLRDRFPQLTEIEISEMLEVNRSAYRRWVKNDSIALYSADKIAVLLGRHPRDIWGDLWFSIPIVENLTYTKNQRRAVLNRRRKLARAI